MCTVRLFLERSSEVEVYLVFFPPLLLLLLSLLFNVFSYNFAVELLVGFHKVISGNLSRYSSYCGRLRQIYQLVLNLHCLFLFVDL